MRLDGATNDPFLNSRTFAAEQGLQIPSPNSQREQELLQRQTLPQFSELEAEANQRLANMPAVDFGGTGRQDGTQAYPFSAPQQAGPQSTFQPMGGYGFIPQSQIPTPPARQEGSSFMGGVDNFLGTFMRAATPEQELGYTPPSMGDVLATAGIRSAGGGIIGDPGRTEARTGPMPITLQPTQTPSATTQEPPASPQTPVATTTQPSYDPNRQFAFQGGYTNPLAAGIEMAGGSRQVAEGLQGMTAPQQPQTPQQGLTSPGGMPLSEFLAGGTDPSKGITRAGLQTDPQGRMITPGADRSAYEQKAAEREARIGQPSEFFAAQTSGNVPSDVRQIQMKDPSQRSDKENKRLSQFASSTLGKQLESQGVDLMTGKLVATDGMTFDQKMRTKEFELKEKQFVADLLENANKQAPLTPSQKKFAEEAGKGAFEWDQGGRQGAQENIQKFSGVLDGLASGQVDTRTLSEFVPFGGDWWRSAMNPTGQQALDNIRGVIFQGLRETLGAQFTEKEGERLVNAAYNPKLGEAENIQRLRPALNRMRAVFQAKENLTQHIINGGDIRDYQGKTPMDVYRSFDKQTSGSPIEGDVDVQTEADEILNSL